MTTKRAPVHARLPASCLALLPLLLSPLLRPRPASVVLRAVPHYFPPSWCAGSLGLLWFFCLFIPACDLYRSWRRAFCPIILSAVRAVAAHCKLPFALRPGLSRKGVKINEETTPEITKEKTKETRTHPHPYSCCSSADAMKEGMGRNSDSSSPAPSSPAAPSSSASTSCSSSRSRRSRSSHSDTSLPVSPASGGGTSLPSSHIRGSEKVQHRPAAPLIRQEVPDRPPEMKRRRR